MRRMNQYLRRFFSLQLAFLIQNRLRISLFLGALGILFVHQLFLKENSIQRRFYSPPPQYIEHMSFGHRQTIGDALWLRLLQNLDYCGEAFEVEDEGGPALCQKGWAFQMLWSISDLDPRFEALYRLGGVILSVVLSDVEGAAQLFDRGVERFPEDWALSYRAAFHFLEEVNDQEKAARLLVQAGQHGAPEWVFSLAARLETERGRAIFAESILLDALESLPDSRFRGRIEERLEMVRAELAKSEYPDPGGRERDPAGERTN